MSYRPASGPLMTRWAAGVDPENVWPEYPRPQMTRPDWLNLNGLWNFAITRRLPGAPPDQPPFGGSLQPIGEDEEDGLFVRLAGQILVPFPIESALSGVKYALRPDERLWYWRTFRVPPEWRGRRVLLHFGAVDWETVVWVNGAQIGLHRGGYLPFTFEVTPFLKDGDNDLVVAVWDPTDTHWQQRGKQSLAPKSIWYTAVSGIWQTVWLEPVPQAYIAGLKITPDVDAGQVRVKIRPGGAEDRLGAVRVQVRDAGRLVAQAQAASARDELRIPIPRPSLWSPDSPHLYEVEIAAGEDRVGSYFGMRKFSLGQDEQGRTRLCLNNRPLFLFGPLDQGYWPDGLYTPPCAEAMRWDLELIKGLGCNMLRKHVKVEPARYYYECDRLGLIVWQDMPNGGKSQTEMQAIFSLLFGPKRQDDRALWRHGRNEPESREDFLRELQEMVEHLYHFPCIAVWVPFNEGWGQFEARAVAARLRDLDPTRLVDHASGWFDQGAGDFRSRHIYGLALKPEPLEARRAAALTEFGGYSLKVEGHLWNPAAAFGYKKFESSAALTEAYLLLLEEELKPWVEAGLSAAIYTQTTDVEIEVNGYVTYDRQVEKMDFDRLREAHRALQG
ncbi:MAG: sugar-binding domain-containing protein [Anaerolineales bacterium]